MTEIAKLGPLAALVGAWEGDQGLDTSWSHGQGKSVETPFRERMTFEALGPVNNGRQELYGLDYRTFAWRIGEADPFHTEVGYWLWDAAAGEVYRCFMVPRGSTILAGGKAAPDARVLEMKAEVGSTACGILSNPYLDQNAKTVAYDLKVEIGDGTLSYSEDTVIEFARQSGAFHHTDANTLKKV